MIHLAPAQAQKGRQVTIPTEVDAVFEKMMSNAERKMKQQKEKKA